MIDFEQRFRDCIKEMGTLGEEYARSKAQSWYLQEMRKVVLANLIKSTEGKTQAEKENLARTHEDYQVHLEGTREAIYQEQIAKEKLEKVRARYEALRSLASQQTASLKFGG
jgi:hypothetical protein